jgi:hypothetical protein
VVIRKQLVTVFYGSPERYFEYIENVLSIQIEKELKDTFAEIKASRDIIVHNSGIANEIYVGKRGMLCSKIPSRQFRRSSGVEPRPFCKAPPKKSTSRVFSAKSCFKRWISLR